MVAPPAEKFSTVTLTAMSDSPTKNVDWFRYLMNNFDLLVARDGHVCILSGAHGAPDGGLLRSIRKPDGTEVNAEDFVQEDINIVENFVKVRKRKEIKDLNVTFEVVDIFEFANTSDNVEVIFGKLGAYLREIKPCSLILAFCFSKYSYLNRVLQREGIFAYLALHEDRMNISGKR